MGDEARQGFLVAPLRQSTVRSSSRGPAVSLAAWRRVAARYRCAPRFRRAIPAPRCEAIRNHISPPTRARARVLQPASPKTVATRAAAAVGTITKAPTRTGAAGHSHPATAAATKPRMPANAGGPIRLTRPTTTPRTRGRSVVRLAGGLGRRLVHRRMMPYSGAPRARARPGKVARWRAEDGGVAAAPQARGGPEAALEVVREAVTRQTGRPLSGRPLTGRPPAVDADRRSGGYRRDIRGA